MKYWKFLNEWYHNQNRFFSSFYSLLLARIIDAVVQIFRFPILFFLLFDFILSILGNIKVKTLWEGQKIWKKVSHVIVLTKHCFYSVSSKQVGDFFKFLWPSKKSSTLINVAINFYAQIIKLIVWQKRASATYFLLRQQTKIINGIFLYLCNNLYDKRSW